MDIKDEAFFCSWSGGKDSCLSLYYAIQEGGIPDRLITMLTENKKRSRAHGLSLDLLKSQSMSLNIPLTTFSTSWKDCENNFLSVLKDIKKDGIKVGVFGDLDLEEHRDWVKNICNRSGLKAYHPLWKKPKRKVLEEFVDAGFKAIIIVVKDGVLDKKYLGKVIDKNLIKEFGKIGIDPAGENGEYHSVVTGGPIFNNEIDYELEEQFYDNGCWFQNIRV